MRLPRAKWTTPGRVLLQCPHAFGGAKLAKNELQVSAGAGGVVHFARGSLILQAVEESLVAAD